MGINFQQFLGELDRKNVKLSLRGGKIATEPPLPPGLRNTMHLLESEVLAHLLRGSDTAPPLQNEDPQTMPPDIQAAYNRDESVTFSKERGQWELYKLLEPPIVLSDEALELMDKYHLGKLPEPVYNRLTELFTENPQDIEARLETAAHFVKEQEA